MRICKICNRGTNDYESFSYRDRAIYLCNLCSDKIMNYICNEEEERLETMRKIAAALTD
uniref:Uncharacterized protein n=1 Tax=viral metagenome TaxID=1070528 RepID=A0A6M3K2F5_9ZZZZ